MSLPYHEGELDVQARTGEFNRAVDVAAAIRPFVPPPVVRFLADQPWLLLGGCDVSGAVWASAWSDQPGFLLVPDPETLQIRHLPARHDPLHRLTEQPGWVGLLAIDLGRRRRVRINGRGEPVDGGVSLRVEQAYPNCMKYINRRETTPAPQVAAAPPPARRAAELTPGQRELVRECDTFFLATLHPDGPADVSHRGGGPGFVSVLDRRRLRWPDYVGNAMFNSLGNLHLDPRAGVLIVDFATGGLLHLSGQGTVDYDTQSTTAYPGAERVVTLDVEHVLHRPAALPLHFGPPERSPFTPEPPAPLPRPSNEEF